MVGDDGDRGIGGVGEPVAGGPQSQSFIADRIEGGRSTRGTLVMTAQQLQFEPDPAHNKRPLLGRMARRLRGGADEADALLAGPAEQQSPLAWSALLSHVVGCEAVPGTTRLRVSSTAGESCEFQIHATQRSGAADALASPAVRDVALMAIELLIAKPAQLPADVRVDVTPEGVPRTVIGTVTGPPPDATVDPVLAGEWQTDGPGPEGILTLGSDGSLTGWLQVAEGDARLDLHAGRWWMEGPAAMAVRLEVSAPSSAADPVPGIVQLGTTLQLTALGDDRLTAATTFADLPVELHLRRAAVG